MLFLPLETSFEAVAINFKKHHQERHTHQSLLESIHPKAENLAIAGGRSVIRCVVLWKSFLSWN
jgi:hypothetical protein